jgi:hypothetical protein
MLYCVLVSMSPDARTAAPPPVLTTDRVWLASALLSVSGALMVAAVVAVLA